MNREDIKKNNRMIAEFMGRHFSSGTISDFKGHDLPKSLQAKLKYHINWAELMPVIDRIKSMGFEYIVNGYACKFKLKNRKRVSHGSGHSNYIISGDTTITGHYEIVCRLLNWISENKITT